MHRSMPFCHFLRSHPNSENQYFPSLKELWKHTPWQGMILVKSQPATVFASRFMVLSIQQVIFVREFYECSPQHTHCFHQEMTGSLNGTNWSVPTWVQISLAMTLTSNTNIWNISWELLKLRWLPPAHWVVDWTKGLPPGESSTLCGKKPHPC